MPEKPPETRGDVPDELRNLAAQLALERARLAETQSVAKVGSWELDLRTNVLSWSDENYRIFELDVGAFDGTYEAFLERVHPDDRAAVGRAYLESVAERVPYAIDHRMCTSDGRLKIVHERCRTFYDDHGTAIRSVGTTQDVTADRLAEAALYDSRQALRAVLDSVPQRVFWKDRNSLYLGCNRSFAADMGFDDPQDVIGKSDLDATWRASAERYQNDDRSVVLSGRPKLDYEEPMVFDDGREGWLRTSKVPLLGRDGSVTGIIGTYEDVTERKRLEQQLFHAQRLEAVGTLAAGMAHEINNPLTYVIANVEICREWLQAVVAGVRQSIAEAPDNRTLSDALQRLVEIEEPLLDALSGAERVARLVLDVKNIVRRDDSSRAPRDLRGIVETAIKMTANGIRHSASVRTHFGAAPFVDASDGPLVQVITNLLINAAQAIGDGRAETNEISVATYADSTGWACVEVRDTGPGITADVLPRIFDPFFTTKGFGAGMGLGLSTSHSIVVELGGRLTVECPLGGGAVFRVSLPPAASPATTSAPAILPTTATSKAKVLVIDDEPSVAIAIGRMLRGQHDVTVLTDGREALALIAAGERYDFILCDLMMPNASGIEIHDSMAAISRVQASKIVFMTGGAFTDASRQFLAQPGRVHITKPFLAKTIRSMVAERKG